MKRIMNDLAAVAEHVQEVNALAYAYEHTFVGTPPPPDGNCSDKETKAEYVFYVFYDKLRAFADELDRIVERISALEAQGKQCETD